MLFRLQCSVYPLPDVLPLLALHAHMVEVLPLAQLKMLLIMMLLLPYQLENKLSPQALMPRQRVSHSKGL